MDRVMTSAMLTGLGIVAVFSGAVWGGTLLIPVIAHIPSWLPPLALLVTGAASIYGASRIWWPGRE